MPLVVYVSGLLSTFFTKPLNLYLGRKVRCFKSLPFQRPRVPRACFPVKDTFSRRQVYERVGISLVKVRERVGKIVSNSQLLSPDKSRV